MITHKTIKGCHLTGYRLTGFVVGSVFDDVSCLISNGVLNSAASFQRSGDVQLESGTIFGPNEYVRYQGSGVHHGQFTNRVLHNSDLTQGVWTKRGTGTVDPDGKTITVDIDQNDLFQIALGYAADVAVDLSFYFNKLGETTGVMSILSPLGGGLGDWQIDISLLPDGDVFITKDHPAVSEVNGYMANGAGQSGVLFRSLTSELTVQVSGVVIIESLYSVNPIAIPTSGSPVSVDTAASDLSTLHGFTASFSDPKARWLWDVLDGRADGQEVSRDIGFDNPSVWTGTGSVSGSQAVLQSSQFIRDLSTLVSGPGRYSVVSDIDTNESSIWVYNSSNLNGRLELYGVGQQVGRFTTLDTDSRLTILSVSGTAKVNSLSSIEVTPATGTLTFKNLSIRPTTAQWQTVGTQMILMAQEDGTPIFWIDKADGKYKISDGTNVASSLQAYTAGQNHTVSIVLGGDQMQVVMDGVNGPIEPFTGTLIDGTNTLKFNYLNEDITFVEDICGSSTANFSEALHLAQELAHTL